MRNSRGEFVSQFRDYLADGGAASVARGKRKEEKETSDLAQRIEKSLQSDAPISPGGKLLIAMIAKRLGLDKEVKDLSSPVVYKPSRSR